MPATGETVDGPVLYLESNRHSSGSGGLCPGVFDDRAGEDYRVVFLTASQSMRTLAEEWDLDVENVNGPSEAAVIMASPQSEGESATTRPDGRTPLHAVEVDPGDLTGISIAFSRLVESWGEDASGLNICLQDIESLLTYHDEDVVYRFLNTVLATLEGASARVHAHVNPATVNEQTLELLKSLFARTAGESLLENDPESTSPIDSQPADRTVGGASTQQRTRTADVSPVDLELDETANVTSMSEEEINAFLDAHGNGVLAFGGESPYAVPMSYGYDPTDGNIYVHLSSFEGSEKQRRLAESNQVSLVVTDYERPDRWRSIVARGSISRLTDDEVREHDVLEAYADAELASVNVFDRPLSSVDFDWFVLEPAAVSGRKALGDTT